MSYKFDNFFQMLECNVLSHPNKISIIDDSVKITNKDLLQHINRCAAYLHQIGIKYGDHIGILVSNSWEFIVILFAVSKLGAVSVPINSFLKSQELNYIFNDAGIKVLFASHHLANEVKDALISTMTTIWVTDEDLIGEVSFKKDVIDVVLTKIVSAYDSKLNDIAFILYTSGTTGNPKGAKLSYKNIFSNCICALDRIQIFKRVNMVTYLPMFHAFTLVTGVLVPIYMCGKIIVIRKVATKADFKLILKSLLLYRSPVFCGIPDIYNILSKAKIPFYFLWLHSIKVFISGAAPLSDDVYNNFNKKFKRGKLLQGYGITECSPVVSCCSAKLRPFGSVGQPLPGYQVKIVDEDMKALTPGQVGEICVKGDCVMQGYLNNESATKEAIVDGWFKTGDLGRVDENNCIFIIDRKKDLIIHKGMNIYPREIEEVMSMHTKVNSCAVIGINDKSNNEIPVIYVELCDSCDDDKESYIKELKSFLQDRLARFKCPRQLYLIDKLPRNATGKILKRKLRELHNNDNY